MRSLSAKLLGAAFICGSDALLVPAPRVQVQPSRAGAASMAFGGGAAAPGERIVITGVGVVSAIGSGEEFWNNLVAGKSGITPITGFDASKFPTTIGGEVKDFEAKPWFNNPKNAKATDRCASGPPHALASWDPRARTCVERQFRALLRAVHPAPGGLHARPSAARHSSAVGAPFLAFGFVPPSIGTRTWRWPRHAWPSRMPSCLRLRSRPTAQPSS